MHVGAKELGCGRGHGPLPRALLGEAESPRTGEIGDAGRGSSSTWSLVILHEEPDMLSSRRTALILVASSDDDARRICTAFLRHADYDVLQVDDADQVVVAARRARPDLIITSHPTRTSTGETVTEQVRHDAVLAPTSILNLASRVLPADLAAAEAAGVTASLAMPDSIDALVETVRRMVGPAPPPGPDPGVPEAARLRVAGARP